MFGVMKRAMVVVAVAAVGAVAPSVASADRWYVGSTALPGGTTTQIAGESNLAYTVQVAPGVFFTMSCDVNITADIYNVLGTGRGDVMGVDATEHTCAVSGVPNCAISAVNVVTPWTVEILADTRVRFGGVDATFSMVSSGGPCALAGNRQITGSVTGTWSNATNELQFVNEPGLAVTGLSLGVVNGNAYFEEEGTGVAVTLGT